MFKHYFEQIDNIEIWPVISLVLFFVFFLGTILWITSLDKTYIDKMKGLPFEDDSESETIEKN
ncbi:MAG: cytochrome C oxidase Cbb3 [Cyclobacteriaceae bacterium]|nr:cytochrome C oxidase Cbb3 [Cyclobacteriaceae bacterium]